MLLERADGVAQGIDHGRIFVIEAGDDQGLDRENGEGRVPVGHVRLDVQPLQYVYGLAETGVLAGIDSR